MTPRHVLLRVPHMAPLRDHPALDAMSDGELRTLAAFMGFCAEHRLGDPGGADIQAFARLRDQSPDALSDLRAALARLGLGQDLLDEIDAVQVARIHQAEFAGITKSANRAYKRKCSVPVEDLPTDWQKTLRRLHLEGEYSSSILERMEARLGMFAWSAERAGHPVDLADTAALKALYEDMRARSIKRQQEQAKKKGLDDAIDTPRWAYLRSTWEELRRFAGAHGLPDEVCNKIGVTYTNLVAKEGKQSAHKLHKAKEAGTRPKLLKEAEAMLAKAETLKLPQMRYALRNRAAAIALGCLAPARPGDVQAHHVFGKGIAFDPARNGYTFRYKASKTAGTTGADIDIPLRPRWNTFIDALILQDEDPRYLAQLRAKVIEDRRPLYVHYDGTPAAYSWYSRMWFIVTETGGHIARTLIYDEAIQHGAEGIQYARICNGHSPTSNVVRSYESERLGRERILHSQEAMAALAAVDDDDDEI